MRPTISWQDYRYWTAMAELLDCIVFWHFDSRGDFIPFLMPMRSASFLVQ